MHSFKLWIISKQKGNFTISEWIYAFDGRYIRADQSMAGKSKPQITKAYQFNYMNWAGRARGIDIEKKTKQYTITPTIANTEIPVLMLAAIFQ